MALHLDAWCSSEHSGLQNRRRRCKSFSICSEPGPVSQGTEMLIPGLHFRSFAYR